MKTCIMGSSSPNSMLASTLGYGSLSHGYTRVDTDTAQAIKQITLRTAGTFSNLSAVVTSNDRATSTLRFQKNGVDGNMSLSLSGTGQFMDATNTDVLVAGDKYNYRITTGAGGTSFIMRGVGCTFEASDLSKSVTLAAVGDSGKSFAGTSVTTYLGVFGGIIPSTTEADSRTKIKFAATCSNASVTIGANTRVTATTFVLRVNSATPSGGPSISVAGLAASGIFEDLTGTVTITANSYLGWAVTVGTGINSIEVSCLKIEIASTTGHAALGIGGNISSTLGTFFIRYLLPSGNYVNSISTVEADVTNNIGLAANTSIRGFTAYVISNGITANSTCRLRKNGVNTSMLINIGSGLTGEFEDDANPAVVSASTDRFTTMLSLGSSGTNLVFSNLVYYYLNELPVGGSGLNLSSSWSRRRKLGR